MRSPLVREPAPFVTCCRSRTVAKRRLDHVRGPEMLPVLGGEVEEREQRVGDLYARLEPPSKLIEDVAELVDLVTLLACLRPHIAHGRPEAEGSIANRDQGYAHAPALQIAQHRGQELLRKPFELCRSNGSVTIHVRPHTRLRHNYS